MTIVEFLEARIAEDEAVARDAIILSRDDYKPHPDLSEWMYEGHEVEYVQTPEMLAHKYAERYYVTMDSEGLTASVDETVGTHIARHDPARVLRECTAKRAIIAQAEREDAVYEKEWQFNDAAVGAAGVMQDVLRTLAAIYSDHADFDPSWSA